MYGNIFVKLAVFYVVVSATQAAAGALCVTAESQLNKSDQYPIESEFNSTRLLLRDCPFYPCIGNAVDHIRSFIVDKLDLPHLEWRVLQATCTGKGLLFEMASSADAKDVLRNFGAKLCYKDCRLKATTKDFYTTETW